MKLYFSPGACSLSPHIVLRESGLPFELEQVDLRAKKTKSGADFLAINPKGQVPTLQLDNGQVLTEGPAIVQYVADLKPESNLAPKNGTLERSRVQEWLNFTASELHKRYGLVFRPTVPEEYKPTVREELGQRYAMLDKQLGAGGPFLTGAQFTVADAYMFVMLHWAKRANIDISQWHNVKAYFDRIAARPKVQEVFKAEGLQQ
ncbi:MAG TPA: glutathione transferase GstA [Candidatus Binataceae bacterium]|nr:glutathione transferase GstA [Candidatus Binataceae bacterium]